jgi:hypothetical protein
MEHTKLQKGSQYDKTCLNYLKKPRSVIFVLLQWLNIISTNKYRKCIIDSCSAINNPILKDNIEKK